MQVHSQNKAFADSQAYLRHVKHTCGMSLCACRFKHATKFFFCAAVLTRVKKRARMLRTGITLLHFLSTPSYSNQKNGHKQESDIISLHLPLLSETYHVINKESIARMKKGVIIINVSRGALVDTVAVEGQACYNIGVMYSRIESNMTIKI
jgi:hypothetical protein